MKIYFTNKEFFRWDAAVCASIWGIIIGLIISVNANAQIVDATRRQDGFTEVIKEGKIRKNRFTEASSDWNFSDCILVTRRKDGFTEVYDENLTRLSQGFIGNESFTTFRVNKCSIIIRRNDNWTEIYDKSLRRTYQGFR